MQNKKGRYEAAMVLGAVGDALGYNNGQWEFCDDGRQIHEELKNMGGLNSIHVKVPQWLVSDDTVMHLATAEALSKCSKHGSEREQLYREIAMNYKKCMKDMEGRAPGNMCCYSVSLLDPSKQDVRNGCQVPFSKSGGGCGAAMRSMCIGLRYPKKEQLSDLVAVSIESGWMTHNHPTGYLGSLASALFASYAIQDMPLKAWGAELLKVIPEALEYVKSQNNSLDENLQNWDYFSEEWEKYLKLRQLDSGMSDPVFPRHYNVEDRDRFYRELSFSGCGGSSGHDAPMIAYDALLGSGGDWEELCSRAMFHGGDSDSTGTIAGFCFGAMYGFQGVPEINFKDIEYKDRLLKEARNLFALANEKK
ncbi:ADP-ribosylhydrolase ARH1-like [Saccostrea echinata]|uniref:ADP-ribosylhydrolase ARH1-like n=1 Tax=Saccostrea echinata TaxID=191078 RepID=UPI002A7EED1D|nr:ADP-ribosylhydrolase ARH1-like [Saccostrea echinata]